MRRIELIPNEYDVILFTGSREWDNIEIVFRELIVLPKTTVIVHGYADGLDLAAKIVCEAINCRNISCPAHWHHNTERWLEVYGQCHGDCNEICGRPAGMIRNHWMLDMYHPKQVIGFHNNIETSKGTKGMLDYAARQHVPTRLVTEK